VARVEVKVAKSKNPKPNKIMMARRQAIKATALASAAFATLPGAIAQTNSAAPAAAIPSGPFTLPPLPYAYDALEPFIDAETMHIHHDQHHATYVANLNKAASEMVLQGEFNNDSVRGWLMNLNNFPEKIRTAIRNNGGGHYNHSLFWQMMKKDGGGEPTGNLAKEIDTAFGSFSAFKETFTKTALGQFGSGWAWLVLDRGTLKIESTPNQDSPISQPATNQDGRLQFQIPLLGLDVWEHAYYLKYQNKRVDYIAAWWNVINWDFVAERFSTRGNPRA
jgi:superoxide dismutase, Fe-Mn family